MKKVLAFSLGVVFAVSALAVDHPYCYWTGAAGDKSVDTADNWKDADGNVLTAVPGNDAYLVFTNITTALTVTKSSEYKFYGYIVRDCTADIKLGTSKSIYLNAGGVLQESSSGAFYLNYTTYAYGGTNVIDVAQPGATVAVQNGFNLPSSDKNKEVVVKRGPGTFLTVATDGSTFSTGHHELLLEGGTWQIRSKTRNWNGVLVTFGGNDCDFNFDYDYALTNVTLRETAAANAHTHGFSGSGTLEFAGSKLADTTFHGRFRDSISLNWNPSAAAKLTLAGATHPTAGNLTVSNGEVALTDGTWFFALGELAVANGAVFSMAAGTRAHVAHLSVEDGGKVKLAAGVCLQVDRLTVAGVVQDPGVYTASAGWVEGAGCVYNGVYPQATWTGGGETASLTDPANWGGTCPDFGFPVYKVTFPAKARVSVPDGAYAVYGVSFAGADVVLEGEGELLVGSEGLSASASAKVGCPVRLEATTVPITASAGAELTFVGTGFSGGETFPTANVTLSGAGTTTFAAGAAAQNLGKVTISSGATMEIASDAGDCTVGTTTVLNEGGTLIVARDFIAGKTFTWNGHVRLQGGVIGSKDGGNDNNGNCMLGETADLTVEGPAAKRYHVYSNNSRTIRNYAETDDATGTLLLSIYTSKADAILTFKGTKSTRFTGKLKNTANNVNGKYTLNWAPTDAAAVLEVARSTYDNDGIKGTTDFAVSAGTLRFADGATLTEKSAVSAAAGATLAFGTNARSVTEGSITVADGATFALADGWMQSIASGVLTIAGEAIADGQYVAGETDSRITGRGLLLVGPQTDPAPDPHVWTGGGATTSLTDPANWDFAPNFMDGSLLATFPADAQVSLPATDVCRLRGIRFAGESPSFTLTGGGRVYLGADGLTALGAESEVTIDTPVTFEKDLTICVTNKLILTENGVLSAMDLSTILTLACGGSVEIRSSNPLLGIVKAIGTIHAYADNALGGARATFIQEGKKENDVLVLHGCSLDCDIDLRGGDRLSRLEAQEGVSFLNGSVKPTGGGNEEQFTCLPGAELHFRGGVTYTGGNNGASWSPVSSYTVHVDSKPMDSTRIALGGTSKGDEGRFYINVASNRFPRGVVFRNANAKTNVLYTTVPYALYADGASGVTFGETAANAVWDLCGCDQGVGVFFSRTTAAVVTSETPATLHLVDNALNYVKISEMGAVNLQVSLLGTASQVDRTCFAGAAGFSKEGSYTHYMMGTSTSAGTVAVAKGRLIFTKESSKSITLPQEKPLSGSGGEDEAYVFTPLTGSWRNASEVVISGGVLELEHSQVFGKTTDVRFVGDAGRLQLNAGVKQRCRFLEIGGVRQELGTWGGPESSAEHKSDFFTGTGVLAVYGDGNPGLVLIFR